MYNEKYIKSLENCLRLCLATLLDLLQSEVHGETVKALSRNNVDLAVVYRILNLDDFEKKLIKDTDLYLGINYDI